MARDIFLNDDRSERRRRGVGLLVAASVMVVGLVVAMVAFYQNFVIDVPIKHVAVLIKKTGKDVENGDEIAPTPEHKGVQKELLREGRYIFKYTSYGWSWDVIPQVEINDNKLGVKIRLYGDDLPYGEFLAREEHQKGIVPGALKPGRYPINPHIERIEIHDPQVIEAGFKGVVTNLAGEIPTQPDHFAEDIGGGKLHKLIVKNGFRGVQTTTLDPGRYFFNPYEKRISQVDCRSQRFNLTAEGDMGFPSKDGFWVSLDGIIEFRVMPDRAAEVFVTYNEDTNGEKIDDEIINKVILPNARSFCRLEGSNKLGREFIQGDTRTQFQERFQEAMKLACEPLGIEIIQALITEIKPPEKIAEPVREREIAKQQLKQYEQQTIQQQSEQELAKQTALVTQRQALVKAEQDVVKIVFEAQRAQRVAIIEANQKLQVAQLELEAAKDKAEAITARGEAAADVVRFQNEAEAAGWKRAVEAFGGDGNKYAQYVLFEKLSAAYRSLMINTADSPIMKIFEEFGGQPTPQASNSTAPVIKASEDQELNRSASNKSKE